MLSVLRIGPEQASPNVKSCVQPLTTVWYFSDFIRQIYSDKSGSIECLYQHLLNNTHVNA